jgi:tRNA dimethylallyltransferase
MSKVIMLVGPTASGKTKLSIELAKEIKGEIVSADSMQVYKYMDIGTAKPGKEEMSGIKHYLIDEVYPDEEFSVAKYQKLAYRYINEIIAKGKTPIVTGGTGLYINSLLYNINFSETISDWNLRERLKKEAEEKGKEYIYNMLKEIDPEAAKKIHKNDIRRVIRAIEVYKHTNKPISYHQELSRDEPPLYEFITFGLKMDRQKLYERINKRVDMMISNGLIDEVRNLVTLGYGKNTIAMQGLGYKEVIYYLRGLLSFDEAVYLLKRDTRRYAKRQLTWFKKIKDIHWINVEEKDPLTEILKNIKYYIA